MAFMINIEYLGIEEKVEVADKTVLKYINNQDFDIRLKYAIGIDIGTHEVKEQLTMIAAYTTSLMKEKLNPAQKNALRSFLQNKLDEL